MTFSVSEPTRRRASRGSRLSRRGKIIVVFMGLVVAILGWACLARALAPTGNTSVSRFDAIIVLGATIDRDGNPGRTVLSRLTEGVHEYERGVAPRILVTGGEQHGRIQADVMARVLEAQGVPASAILIEPEAGNTIENACFSDHMLKARGLTSAEVVTSPSHLPRAGIIFSRSHLQWRMHAAPPMEPESAIAANLGAANEVLHTAYYLLISSWAYRCSP